jgi:tetratricopeptide (TPR) repeat protein
VVATTDYERELARIAGEIERLESVPPELLTEGEQARQLAYRRYQHATLTGNLRELIDVERTIDAAIERVGPWPDLYLVKANLDFTLHRLAAVRRDLGLASGQIDSPEVRALLADLDVQEGRYEEAQKGYHQLIVDHRSWDNLARLAYLRAKMGDVAGADQLYLEAEDELTAKEMRSYAWLEVQRGLLDFTHGRHDAAEAHYRRANEAYSGYWQVEAQLAELFGAQGKLNDAIALYHLLIARLRRPELQQALGSLYARSGRRADAERWYDRALAEYLESAECGEVHYLHHLAEFYADVRQEGAAAVHWARKDFELRPTFSTQAALAWALLRDGQFGAAFDLMQQCLASGVRDADLFHHAGLIYQAVGRVDEGHLYLHAAAEINPHYQAFHVHH